MIGIALGLAGLVTVLTMGDSVESDLGSNLELLGTATIMKATWDFDRSERWHHGSYSQKDIDDLRRLPGVAGVTPVVWIGYAEASYGDKQSGGCQVARCRARFPLDLPCAGGCGQAH